MAAAMMPPVFVKPAVRSEIRCAMPSSAAVAPSRVSISLTLSRSVANAAANFAASNLRRPAIASWSSVDAAVPVEMPRSAARFFPGVRPVDDAGERVA